MTTLLAVLAASEVLTANPVSEASLLRATRIGVQTWDASPERVLPLLSPRGEAAWAVGWEPEIRWQASGNGEGTLFVTRTHHDGEALWLLQTFDSMQHRVAYTHLLPGILLVELSIALSPLPDGRTRGEVRYTYTALSERGNTRVAEMTEEHFAAFMRDWESELNHFLRTGRKPDAAHP